jgi:hypothetical protein
MTLWSNCKTSPWPEPPPQGEVRVGHDSNPLSLARAVNYVNNSISASKGIKSDAVSINVFPFPGGPTHCQNDVFPLLFL